MPRNWSGVAHLPFQDEVPRIAMEEDGLFVFNIYSLSATLNTRDDSDYMTVKERIVNDVVSPFELSIQWRRARTFVLELCSAMEDRGHYSQKCWDALGKLGCS